MDDKAFKLQRSGQMGTFAQATGQEGCQAPIALLMDREDWIVPAFRENCLFISTGNSMKNFFLYYMGNEYGSRTIGNMLPVSIPVGTQPLHAVGIAWAANIKKQKTTVFTFFGDGATSEGDFHEAMNWAAVFKTPVVFICQNNQYAISTSVVFQTASRTIAQKAYAYGMMGVKVDGNDPLAMYALAKEAKEYTRQGKGPVLIEAYTYRLSPHTTADDPTLYRSDQEVELWKKKDPIVRFEFYLKKQGWLAEEIRQQIYEDAQKEVEDAVVQAKAERETVEDIFKWTYAEMTAPLKEQLAYLKQFTDKSGEPK